MKQETDLVRSVAAVMMARGQDESDPRDEGVAYEARPVPTTRGEEDAGSRDLHDVQSGGHARTGRLVHEADEEAAVDASTGDGPVVQAAAAAFVRIGEVLCAGQDLCDGAASLCPPDSGLTCDSRSEDVLQNIPEE